MSRTKYIIKNNSTFVIFDDITSHADMARDRGWNKDQLHSAGFVSFGADDKRQPVVWCYGDSVTLKLKTIPGIDRDSSTGILERNLFPHKYEL